jgi:uncharacterized RDD family membrane protein YckC
VSAEIVTGEAVPLDLRLARWPSRGLAFVIDAAVQFGALAGGYAIFLGAMDLRVVTDSAVAAAIAVGWVVTVFVGYPVLCETLWRGRTLGKKALGLRVVRDDGGPIRFRQALARGLLALLLDLWMTWGLVALVTSIVSRRGKRVGDVLAGTVVVAERVPKAAGRAREVLPQMPPQLVEWAQHLDVSGLPDALALEGRQLLGRYAELDPTARTQLELRIARDIADVVTPPPPPGTPPWAYVSAVLAERRRREEAKNPR